MIALPFSTSGPTITALSAEGSVAPLRRLFFLSTRLAFSAAVLFAVELGFFGRDFIRLWAGRAVVVDAATFAALVAILVVNVLQQPAYAFIIATTRHRTFSWLSLLEGAANLVLSLWWVRRWGVLGVALGTLVPQALVSGVYLLVAGARMNGFAFSELWKANLRSLAFPAWRRWRRRFSFANFQQPGWGGGFHGAHAVVFEDLLAGFRPRKSAESWPGRCGRHDGAAAEFIAAGRGARLWP